jgi:hypothetical protein
MIIETLLRLGQQHVKSFIGESGSRHGNQATIECMVLHGVKVREFAHIYAQIWEENVLKTPRRIFSVNFD